MGAPSILAEEFLREAAGARFGAACLDVRSEGEAEAGAVPGFLNLPILNNEERHRVGLTYKLQGRREAIQLGHGLVSGAIREARIAAWTRAIDSVPQRRAYVACWRGGLRSRIAHEWIRDAGREAVAVQGGYKAIRRALMRPLKAPLLESPRVMVLSGLTGAGKTDLLRSVGREGLRWIDLEGHARHRGSSFGLRIGDRQPSQATFENALAWDLQKLRGHGAHSFWVEDESRCVGSRLVPDSLKNAMSAAPVVFLDVPIERRCANIFSEYVLAPLEAGIAPAQVRQAMLSSALALRKKLGGALCDEIARDLDDAFEHPRPELDSHRPWIQKLLEHYYDKTYRFAFERQSRPLLFQGDEIACRQWMLERSV